MGLILALRLIAPPQAAAEITEIIDATGDGGGNTLDTPSSIAVDASGNVYVTGAISNNAFKITPGGTVTQIIDSTGVSGNPLLIATSVAVDLAENVYVAGKFSAAVFKITPGGIITQIIDSSGDGANTFSFPTRVVVDSGSNVYAATSEGAFRITPGGTITQIINAYGAGGDRFTGGTGDRTPLSLAIGVSGNVYATGLAAVLFWDPSSIYSVSFETFSGVFKITPEGDIAEIHDYHATEAEGLFFQAYVAAVDSSDNVYVTGPPPGNALKITPLGNITEIMDATGDGDGNPLVDPTDIATDSSGNVYVMGSTSHNVFKIDVGLPACNDGVDNDSDGLTDFPLDPGCQLLASESEDPICDDGIDNDSDSLTDFPADPGCKNGYANIENPECSDGLDNDTDGKTDFGSDPQCASAADDSELELARNWVGTLEIRIGAWSSTVTTGQGVAYFSGGSVAVPSQMRLAGGIGVVNTTPVDGGVVASAVVTAKLASGTLVPLSGTGLFDGGTVPLPGIQRFCFLTRCNSQFFSNSLPLHLTTNSGSSGVGVGGGVISGVGSAKEPGSFSIPFPVHISMQSAPWTIGAATLYNQNLAGPVTAMSSGFIHSQASSTAFSPAGSVRIVAPTQISVTDDFGTTHTKIAMFSTLTLQFVPEPTAPLVLMSGAVLLALLGRMTRGKFRDGGPRN
jgi:hypothetical protein